MFGIVTVQTYIYFSTSGFRNYNDLHILKWFNSLWSTKEPCKLVLLNLIPPFFSGC
ncbi:uncharacterized protein LACBIDRAFT_317404 [Laccaria bicolor S238N-H82]|uniref:Predicted protein n=1 Tax=Laccaria bicolor (strain S238N-H82 / ATCC MYA-4686) TaxID=486041 RepID=B0D538_LACBS|nr:uncharacterized protein LACBIDRAFT_317404 [Laccaria bicolor S238N-H82]EDR10453.1 predicted protein [Laccaria bicolor S238N-H82]|eukprot:XP_001878903.1 predicted protein [Laccaria bicolor S238N-H82]